VKPSASTNDVNALFYSPLTLCAQQTNRTDSHALLTRQRFLQTDLNTNNNATNIISDI